MSSDRAISPVSATLASDYSFSKDVVKKLDHVLIAVDGSHASDLAFSWALSKLIDPARHVIYLLSVARINPQASMMYSAGLGNSFFRVSFSVGHVVPLYAGNIKNNRSSNGGSPLELGHLMFPAAILEIDVNPMYFRRRHSMDHLGGHDERMLGRGKEDRPALSPSSERQIQGT